MEKGGDRMIYVLIVVSYLVGSQNGQTVSFQEFNSKEACEYAMMFIKENRYSRYSHDHYKIACLAKG